MSLKYERVKKADLALPAPLRLLTRAFSSITLAITLLVGVVLFGTIASVPLVFLLRFIITLALIATGAGLASVAAYNILIGRLLASSFPTVVSRVTLALLLFLAGVSLSAFSAYYANDYITSQPWYELQKATVLYRLPYFEMTEAEFYAWWPMRTLLGLFVINMVWATIRRIEFKFANIGVLTVHTGIVTVAVGSIIYSANKMEGDTIIWRRDLGGRPVSEFYDTTRPALYFLNGDGRKLMMVDLPTLPRYNDHPLDEHSLHIPLGNSDKFRDNFGKDLSVSINGFIAYGETRQVWVNAADAGQPVPPPDALNPAIEISTGSKEQPDFKLSKLLVSGIPAERILEQDAWALEFLYKPDPDRMKDLMEPFDGEHGLVVEIPSKNFRHVYPISPGQIIPVADTGYKLTIEAIGPYGMTFATKGYQGVSDTRALVRVEHDDKTFRRIALFRYPERSQDFIPAPGDPNVGPMGKRVDPDPSIRLSYIDASKGQLFLVANRPDFKDITLQIRIPGNPPFRGTFGDDKFPLGSSAQGEENWMHITKRLAHAVQIDDPVIVPKSHRNPKDEGTFIESILPVTFDLPATATLDHKPWSKTVWVSQMCYPDLMLAAGVNRPQWVDVPGLGRVGVIFSRVAHPLPFSIALESFEMQPYPNSDIPRDYVSTLTITHLTPDSTITGMPITAETRLNNPYLADGAVLSEILAAHPNDNPVVSFLTYLRNSRLKLSQSGWDPGDRSDPQHMAKDPAGHFLRQQRYSILTVGNNVAIHIIFTGACLIVMGVPWAFYVKPWLVRRQSAKLREQYAGKKKPAATPAATPVSPGPDNPQPIGK